MAQCSQPTAFSGKMLQQRDSGGSLVTGSFSPGPRQTKNTWIKISLKYLPCTTKLVKGKKNIQMTNTYNTNQLKFKMWCIPQPI